MLDAPGDGWKRIRATGKGDGNLEVPSLTTGVETGYGPALYAVGPKGEPRLLVPFSSAHASSDPRADAWNNVACELDGIRFYRIDKGFPCINSKSFVEGRLPEGVVAIDYEIDLISAERFLLADEARDRAVTEFLA